jgi:predicted  nucleic acid-binding Zn-ribbon protein
MSVSEAENDEFKRKRAFLMELYSVISNHSNEDALKTEIKILERKADGLVAEIKELNRKQHSSQAEIKNMKKVQDKQNATIEYYDKETGKLTKLRELERSADALVAKIKELNRKRESSQAEIENMKIVHQTHTKTLEDALARLEGKAHGDNKKQRDEVFNNELKTRAEKAAE